MDVQELHSGMSPSQMPFWPRQQLPEQGGAGTSWRPLRMQTTLQQMCRLRLMLAILRGQ